MSERKVLNKYYPPDFDPSKIPRMKLPKNRQYTVRLMAPFNMRCKTCGEYIYKGKKFNARKEDVENQDYLGIRIYRFYIKCTRCLQEISFKTDPRNCDYEIEAGATRNFMALKLAEEQAQREENELREEEANNPMKLLENRTIQSKNEIELLESLEELKDLNKRQQAVDYESMLQQYDTRLTAQEIEDKLRQRDEEYIKTIKFEKSMKRKVIVEEEIIEDVIAEPINKIVKKEMKTEEPQIKNYDHFEESEIVNNDKKTEESDADNTDKKVEKNQTWNRSIGSINRKKSLSGIVRIKKPVLHTSSSSSSSSSSLSIQKDDESKQQSSNGLLLLGLYSDSENSE